MEFPEIRDILFPTDCSKASNIALSYALSLAKKYDAQISVIHVVEDLEGIVGFYVPHISTDVLKEEMEAKAWEKLKDYTERRFKGFKNYKLFIRKGRPYEEISKFAEEKKVDLIVMAYHGRSGIDRYVMGSTTERVLRKTPCPVLTIHLSENRT